MPESEFTGSLCDGFLRPPWKGSRFGAGSEKSSLSQFDQSVSIVTSPEKSGVSLGGGVGTH